MGEFAVPNHIRFLKGGGTITYKGTADKCIWWQLVGVDGGVEGAPYGSIDNTTHVTDADGIATSQYHAPTTALDPDQFDRVYVHEDGIITEVDLSPSYINLSEFDYKDDAAVLDRTNRLLWQFASGTPQWWAIDIDSHAIVVNGLQGDADPGWSAWYYDVAESNGRIYVNDDSLALGKVRSLSGTDLTLVNTSPALPASLVGVWVHGTAVYAQTQNGGTRHLTKLPLDLSAATWQTALPNLMGDINENLVEDINGNLWNFKYQGKKLHKFSSSGTLTTYDLTGTLPSPGTLNNWIAGLSYDGNDTLLLEVFSQNGAPSFNRIDYVIPWTISTQTLGSALTSPHMNRGDGGPRRATPGHAWFRRMDNTNLVELDIATMTIVNEYGFASQWALAGDELTAAQTTNDGPLYDGLTNVLWLLNDYPVGFTTFYGIWRLPLP